MTDEPMVYCDDSWSYILYREPQSAELAGVTNFIVT